MCDSTIIEANLLVIFNYPYILKKQHPGTNNKKSGVLQLHIVTVTYFISKTKQKPL